MSDRYEIKILLNKKYSYRSIAKSLNRSVSTISEEINRNKDKNGLYRPQLAQLKTGVRRANASFKGKKIIRYKDLSNFIEMELTAGQTPEAIAGRLKNQEKDLPYVSKDTIYRYQQSPYGKILGLKKQKKKRRFEDKVKQTLKDRKFLDKRPKIVELRHRTGDTEADLIVSGRDGKGVLLVVVCRKLRVVFLELIHSVTIKNIHLSFLNIKKRFPEMKTLTLDNDILFREHKMLEKQLDIKIYFCNPYHSWEKGTVENINKQIRKYLPKGSDLSKYDSEYIAVIEEILNQRFMKCLNYQTPQEALEKYREKQKNNRKSVVNN